MPGVFVTTEAWGAHEAHVSPRILIRTSPGRQDQTLDAATCQRPEKTQNTTECNIEDRPAPKLNGSQRFGQIGRKPMLPRLFVPRGPFTRYPCRRSLRTASPDAGRCWSRVGNGEPNRRDPSNCLMPLPPVYSPVCQRRHGICGGPGRGWKAEADMGALRSCGFDRESSI